MRVTPHYQPFADACLNTLRPGLPAGPHRGCMCITNNLEGVIPVQGTQHKVRGPVDTIFSVSTVNCLQQRDVGQRVRQRHWSHVATREAPPHTRTHLLLNARGLSVPSAPSVLSVSSSRSYRGTCLELTITRSGRATYHRSVQTINSHQGTMQAS